MDITEKMFSRPRRDYNDQVGRPIDRSTDVVGAPFGDVETWHTWKELKLNEPNLEKRELCYAALRELSHLLRRYECINPSALFLRFTFSGDFLIETDEGDDRHYRVTMNGTYKGYHFVGSFHGMGTDLDGEDYRAVGGEDYRPGFMGLFNSLYMFADMSDDFSQYEVFGNKLYTCRLLNWRVSFKP